MLKSKKHLFYLIILIMLRANTALSETIIAIFDSGVDSLHVDLEDKLKTNPLEVLNGHDDDGNGAIDDIAGWNLVDHNQVLLNNDLRGTFSPSIYKYYKIRAKKALETASKKELEWLKKIRKDKEFMAQLKIFKSFIHGTHVTGIAVNTKKTASNIDIKYYPIKYLGKINQENWKEPEFTPLKRGPHKKRIKHIKKHFRAYARWQEKKWRRALKLTLKSTAIVNGSFGKSYKSILKTAHEKYFKEFSKDPSDDLKKELANYFIKKLIQVTEKVTANYPQILFVFSAGNSKDDNDLKFHYPSNARAPNILAVGASKGFSSKASFSNFGKKTVDLFAPGLAIKSTIPSNQYIKINGTSQSAPFVSNVAAKALEMAKIRSIDLSLSNLRKIILKTVDKKKDLKDLCQSGGIINPKRVYRAVSLLAKYSLPTAIKKSHQQVRAITQNKKMKGLFPTHQKGLLRKYHLLDDSLLLPLPEPFY